MLELIFAGVLFNSVINNGAELSLSAGLNKSVRVWSAPAPLGIVALKTNITDSLWLEARHISSIPNMYDNGKWGGINTMSVGYTVKINPARF